MFFFGDLIEIVSLERHFSGERRVVFVLSCYKVPLPICACGCFRLSSMTVDVLVAGGDSPRNSVKSCSL